MRDLVVRLVGEDRVSDTIRQVQNEINGLRGRSLEDINKKFLRIENSTAPLRAKLKSILTLMALMNYDGLDSTPLFDLMALSAGRYRDAIADAQTSISNLSSDTLGMDAAIQGFLAVSGAAAIATGAFALFGEKSEEVEKMLLRIQSLIGIVSGFKAISDTFNKDSALMNWMRGLGAASESTRIATESTRAITAATTADTAALSTNTALRLANERSIQGSNPSLAVNTQEFNANSTAIRNNMAHILEWNRIAQSKFEQYRNAATKLSSVLLELSKAYRLENKASKLNFKNPSAENAQRYLEAVELSRRASEAYDDVLDDMIRTAEKLEESFQNITDAANKTTRGEVVNTKAILAHTTATRSGTAANTGFNLSLAGIKLQAIAAGGALKGLMASIPLMALFMAVGIGLTIVIEKLMALGDESEDTKKKLEALRKKLEELRKRLEDLASSAGKVKAKYWELQSAWKNLQTTAEKTKWIKDNSSEFKNLGLNITSVKTAEDIFVKNTNAIVNALIARAVAAKKAELAAEDLINLEKKRSVKSTATGDYYTKATLKNVTDEELKNAGLRPKYITKSRINGSTYTYERLILKEELDKINKDRQQAALAKLRALKKQYKDEEKTIRKGVEDAVKAEMEANKKLSKFSDAEVTTKTNTNTKSEPKYNPNANTEKSIRDNITILLKQLELLDINSDKYRLIADEIERWKDKLKDIDLANKINKLAILETYVLLKKILDGYLDELEAKEAELAIIKRLLDALYEVDNITLLLFKDLTGLVAKYKALQKEIEDIRKKGKFEIGSIADLEDLVAKIDEKLNNTKLDLQTRLKLTTTKLELQNKIQKLTDTYTIPIKILPVQTENKLGSRENAENNVNQSIQLYLAGIIDRKLLREDVKSINLELENLGLKPIVLQLDADFTGVLTAIDSLNSIKGVSDYINGIGDSFENCENALDYFSAGLDALIGGLLSYMSIVLMITTLNDLFATSSAAAAAADTAATSVEVANSGTKIAAKSGEAIAGATASGASLPFPLNLVAIAAGIAAVIAALSSIGSFANGGIVSSGSLHGDRNLARVNEGEMILNGKLLRRLFNLLNNGGSIRGGAFNGEVEFKISGSSLKGVLKNYDNKMSKL